MHADLLHAKGRIRLDSAAVVPRPAAVHARLEIERRLREQDGLEMLLHKTVVGAPRIKGVIAGIGLRPVVQSREYRAETGKHRFGLAFAAAEFCRIELGEFLTKRLVIFGLERSPSRCFRERGGSKPDRGGKGS